MSETRFTPKEALTFRIGQVQREIAVRRSVRLTMEPQNSYSERRGNIFMAEGGFISEVQKIEKPTPIVDPNHFQNKEIKTYARDFESRRPFSLQAMSLDRLKAEYFYLSLFGKVNSSTFVTQEDIKDFESLEHSYKNTFGDEFRRRGIAPQNLQQELDHRLEEALTNRSEKDRAKLVWKSAEAQWRRLAREGRISIEEAVANIEKGNFPRVEGGADAFTNAPSDATLKNIFDEINDEVGRINTRDANNLVESDYLQRQIERIQNLVDNGRVDQAQARTLLTELNARRYQSRVNEYNEQMRRRGSREGFQSFTLSESDYDQLDTDPVSWLASRFDSVFRVAQQGKDVSVNALGEVQGRYAEGKRYLEFKVETSNSQEERKRWETIQQEFERNFNNVSSLMGTEAMINYRNLEQAQGQARQLGVEGLLYTMGLEDGYTQELFNRLNEKLDYLRQSLPKKHALPEHTSQLLSDLINEQIDIANKDIGIFARGKIEAGVRREFADKIRELEGKQGADQERDILNKQILDESQRRLRSGITRAAVQANAALAITQRKHIIISRAIDIIGGHDVRYWADAIGSFDFFNFEVFMIKKWGLLTAEQQLMLEEMKIDLANDHFRGKKIDPNSVSRERKLSLGKMLFKDFYNAPDFFSSGWRIYGILDQTEKVMKYKGENEILLQKVKDSDRNSVLYNEIFSKGMEVFMSRMTPEQLTLYQEGKNNGDDFRIEVLQTGLENIDKAKRDQLLKGKNSLLTQQELDTAQKKAKERSDSLGLFLRLKAQGDVSDHDTHTEYANVNQAKRMRWHEISKYRPDEIVGLYREKASRDQDFINLFQDPAFDAIEISDSVKHEWEHDMAHSHIPTAMQGSYIGRRRAEYVYDQFREKYGAAIREIQNEHLKTGEQVNMTNLKEEDKKRINKMITGNGTETTEGEKVVAMFKAMKKFVQNGATDEQYENYSQLIRDVITANKNHNTTEATRLKDEIGVQEAGLVNDKIQRFFVDDSFVELNSRTLGVTDLLLNEIEEVAPNSGLVRISKRWTDEPGGDALGRNYGDLMYNQKASQALTAFMTTEHFDDRVKAAIEFGNATAGHSGPGSRAKCIRYTVGTHMLVAQLGFVYDAFGVKGLPFRQPINRLQEIYGPQAHVMEREELREKLDHFRQYLVGAAEGDVGWLSDEEEYLTEPEKVRLIAERRNHAIHVAEDSYLKLQKLLKLEWGDNLTLNVIRGIIYTFLASGVEGIKLTQSAVTGK